jgi:hypothetical protein
VRLGEWAYALGDLDRLNRALDLAGSAEDAVTFTDWVCFPPVKERLATVVRDLLVDLLLLAGNIHLVEDVYGAYGDADAVSDANVKVDRDGNAVHSELFAHALLLSDLMPFVISNLRPFVGESLVVDYPSFRHQLHLMLRAEGMTH